MTNDSDSWLPYAGVGGAVVCCLGLEVLGGAVLFGGLATAIGLSTGITYALVVVLGGILAVLLVAGYHQIGEMNDGARS